MKEITSKDNPTYKEARRLLRKKYRDQTGMFLMEGPRPVRDAVKEGTRLAYVFIRASGAGEDETTELAGLCAENNIDCVLLSDELFDGISDTENSQGVIGAAHKKAPADAGDQDTAGRILILDRLQDPGNIGTIIRTAEAAGFGTLIAMKGTGDVYSPKTVRAAAGSLLRVNVFEGYTASDAVSYCQARSVRIIASDLEGSVEYTAADLTGRIALVIGNEGSGISDEIRQSADTKVRIPMRGNIESLNAAVAAGVLMYETMRQTRDAGKVK